MSFIAALATAGTAIASGAAAVGGTLAAGAGAIGSGLAAGAGALGSGIGALGSGLASGASALGSGLGIAGAGTAGAAGTAGGAGFAGLAGGTGLTAGTAAGAGGIGSLGAAGSSALGSSLTAGSMGLTGGGAAGLGASAGTTAGLGTGAASGLGTAMGATGAGTALPMAASLGGEAAIAPTIAANAAGATPGFLGAVGDFAAAHPIMTQAGTGALLGAATNPNDPLKGAVRGGVAGGIGGYGAETLGGMGGKIGEFATAHPMITGTGISMLAQPLVGSIIPSGPSAEDNLNAANAADREQYLRYLRQYRPSVPPGYAAGGITDLDGYMSNAQNIPNPNEVADPEGYARNSVQMYGGGGIVDTLVKTSLPGMIFGWEGAHDIPLIGGMFNDPNIANLSPEEKKKLLDMAAAQGQAAPAQAMAQGGIADLGGYAAGGRPNLLHGPGDGVSDDIPASIAGKQPARLASGEYVVPSRIVSELGNGSTDAGAKRLDMMVQKVNAGRAKTLGGKKYAADTRAYKHLPV